MTKNTHKIKEPSLNLYKGLSGFRVDLIRDRRKLPKDFGELKDGYNLDTPVRCIAGSK